MTRKRYWRLRNALNVRLEEWGRKNGFSPKGTDNKAMRPVSGKPLVNFELGKKLGFGTSYAECWNCEAMVKLRKSLGMEV